jgi:hypothetical protein
LIGAARQPDGTDAHPALARIHELTAEFRRLDHQRDIAVRDAIVSGATWTQIAHALGVTNQAAHKRYRWLRSNPATGETWHERPLPW